MIFDSWNGLGRVLLVGVLAYVSIVVLLRVSGKRTLTKLNAFDLRSRSASGPRWRPFCSINPFR